MRRPARRGHNRACVENDLFAVSAVAGLRHHHGNDGIAQLHASGNTRTDFIDDPGHIHPRHIRRRIQFLLFRS